MEDALGGGYEGARGDEGEADRQQADDREDREDHHPAGAFEQPHLTFYPEAFGARPRVGSKDGEGHGDAGEQGFVGAGGGGVEEDNTHEDGRLGEPIQGRVEKGPEGTHSVRLAGDRPV